MIVICTPYRSPEDIDKEAKNFYYEYRLDFCENWPAIDFKAFLKKSILTYRGSDLTRDILQDMLSSKALIDLDIEQLKDFPDMVKPERLILSTHLDEYDEDKILRFIEHPQKAKFYKLILKTNSFAEILATTKLIPKDNPRKLIFNVVGKWALLQRSIYELFSSYGFYVALDEPTTAGQPTLTDLIGIWSSSTIQDKRYIAIIGDERANESGSILLANVYFRQSGIRLSYLPVPAGDLSEAIDVIKFLYKKLDLIGLAITSPYKKALAEYLKSPLPIINTAQLLDHKHLHNSYHPELDMYIYSKNTDLVALKAHLQKLEVKKEDKILIYGSGDCAEAFAQHLIRNSFSDVSLLSRNRDKAAELIQKYRLKAAHDQEYDLLINATPLGKKDEDDISHLPGFKKLIDLVLRLDEPALLSQKAEAENLPHMQGGEFWVEQLVPQMQCIHYEDDYEDDYEEEFI
ncbi:MAG: hypothetical protein RBR69_00035 [Candidatus Cloacimonadaceae bacterium]|jgi:shikimate 5-dehydrogenase/3-dehydroquinate dehydratase|nr:hypothetical protein [Candidatus Cloacimonadota bacterium]MDY0126511.1 hypothetical protein [Candidatus Cloacimonadaceae bacterium]MCB5255406.1 hypothetical protein [Candidatus Cloacimonadota bacterium]MCK9177555.1 hypothetical protein [Candidatus Cloacimonadota bacterium]MCK9242205.1 hypothetical protein [Candidatus Cloacimonadota bacterium]